MSASARYGAVLLIGFGGPERRDEIGPFLDRVTRGRPIPRERYEEVARHYEAIGGRSPFNEITIRQLAALRARLERSGMRIPVVLGLRNAAPYLDEVIEKLARDSIRRVLGFVLAAHRCEASWERYLQNVEQARGRLGADAPEVDYVGPWHEHPLFIEAAADRVAEAISRLDPAAREGAKLIFTAHSIPLAMAAASPYVGQLTQSARMVAERIGRRDWTLAFQSRSGNPRDPWLEPDLREVLRGHREGAAVLAPIGFLSDHVEVLYDLDFEAAAVARAAGVTMVRAATVGDHPRFIEMMAALVEERLNN